MAGDLVRVLGGGVRDFDGITTITDREERMGANTLRGDRADGGGVAGPAMDCESGAGKSHDEYRCGRRAAYDYVLECVGRGVALPEKTNQMAYGERAERNANAAGSRESCAAFLRDGAA